MVRLKIYLRKTNGKHILQLVIAFHTQNKVIKLRPNKLALTCLPLVRSDLRNATYSKLQDARKFP